MRRPRTQTLGAFVCISGVTAMLTLQQLLEIACRHTTTMSDAMVAACVARALLTGEPLRLPGDRKPPSARVGARPMPEVDWERMVRLNSDTRGMHQ